MGTDKCIIKHNDTIYCLMSNRLSLLCVFYSDRVAYFEKVGANITKGEERR